MSRVSEAVFIIIIIIIVIWEPPWSFYLGYSWARAAPGLAEIWATFAESVNRRRPIRVKNKPPGWGPPTQKSLPAAATARTRQNKQPAIRSTSATLARSPPPHPVDSQLSNEIRPEFAVVNTPLEFRPQTAPTVDVARLFEGVGVAVFFTCFYGRPPVGVTIVSLLVR
jgi:hypothetical protein